MVAVVGRPNVGKSALFNRICGERIAIVEDQPGVTRDRLYRDAEWLGRPFGLVDTGGFQWEEGDLHQQVRWQAEIAVREADVILFVVDARSGPTVADEDVAFVLRRTGKPVILAVNKVDSYSPEAAAEFYSLGLGTPIPVSAIHGTNVGDLLDAVVERFGPPGDPPEEDDRIRVAVIGRPNVGKSSLVNRLLGEDRMIVSDAAGTTRDSIDSEWVVGESRYLLIDTAGIRRKARIDTLLERVTVLRAFRAVDRSDVVLMMIDATGGVREQDKRIAGYAHEQGKAAILLVNKWDLVEKDTHRMKQEEELIREELGFMRYAPILFVSAGTGQRVHRIPGMVDAVYAQAVRQVPTSVLNQVLRETVMVTPPPSDKGRKLKILYVTQVRNRPPTFVFFVNDPELMHFSYRRHLENRFREALGFEGTPIRLLVRGKREGA